MSHPQLTFNGLSQNLRADGLGEPIRAVVHPKGMKFDANITFLPVTDLQRSHEFYSDRLGLELVLDQVTCRIYGVAGQAFVGVCQRDDAASQDGLIVTFVTDEVDEWYAELAGDLEIEAPKLNPKYDIYHFFLRDPDGHLIEVQRFEDPRWRHRGNGPGH